ncbi:MAG: type II toxin-antitoxin system VapC family toxin [Anaerolineae bacterium]
MAVQICIDAGILIKQIVPEEYSDRAAALWEHAIEAEWEIVAPALFWFEVTAVLRKKVYRRTLTPAEGELALNTALEANVQIISLPDLHRRAWQLADSFQQPTAYDTHYLALAETLQCDFWTADKRLYSAVKDAAPWVKWLGEFDPQYQTLHSTNAKDGSLTAES